MNYIKGLIKSIFRWQNIGTFIFFILNATLIIFAVSAIGEEAMICVGIAYLISIIIALSPIGEALLCLLSGAKKIKRQDMIDKIKPLLDNIHQQALVKTPELTKKINLKYIQEGNPYAFALGRHTICVSEGLIGLSDSSYIEGVLAHEIAHLACHHTDIQLLFGSGNFIITVFLMFYRIITWISTAISGVTVLSKKTRGCGCIFSIFTAILAGIVWLWMKFCSLFLMWSSRANEYAADKYAMELGYGYELAAFLDQIGVNEPNDTLTKMLFSTHPDTNNRIGKLQELGVPYTKY